MKQQPFSSKAKSRKGRLLLGAAFTVLLLYCLYIQVRAQWLHAGGQLSWHMASPGFAIAAFLLLFVNLALETGKWKLMTATAVDISWSQALQSVLGGIACSLITPNRLGEYPGRILFLDQKKSTRLVSVSVLGACAQLGSVLVFGTAGLLYYVGAHSDWKSISALVATAIAAVAVLIFYWSFEKWAVFIERIKWLRRLRLYALALRATTKTERVQVLLLSLLRYLVFTLQYLLLLRWQQVDLPWGEGYLLCLLFFWAMAVIPSIALAELGIRGMVSLYLLQPFSENVIGILAATLALWMLNLAIPALFGAVLLWRSRLLR